MPLGLVSVEAEAVDEEESSVWGTDVGCEVSVMTIVVGTPLGRVEVYV